MLKRNETLDSRSKTRREVSTRAPEIYTVRSILNSTWLLSNITSFQGWWRQVEFIVCSLEIRCFEGFSPRQYVFQALPAVLVIMLVSQTKMIDLQSNRNIVLSCIISSYCWGCNCIRADDYDDVYVAGSALDP